MKVVKVVDFVVQEDWLCVWFGVSVIVVDEDDVICDLMLVGDDEIDVGIGWIGWNLFFVCVLCGVMIGDVCCVDLFVGECEYEVVVIVYLLLVYLWIFG